MKLTEDEQKLLVQVVEHFENEDKSTRERQVRQWKQLKLFWDGFNQVWYSEVAHDWRIWTGEDNDSGHYDKPVNIFRAYLESIIAALSATIPAIKCFPDDADNPLDLETAKASDKIAELIYRHNDVMLLWLHALYIYCTEGMVACYSYSKSDEKYGIYEEKHLRTDTEIETTSTCPECAFGFDSSSDGTTTEYCDTCQKEVMPVIGQEEVEVTKLVGITKHPKTRQAMEVYGGTYVQVANYAKKQEDTPYLIFSYETHFSNARASYKDIREKIHEARNSAGSEWSRHARTSTQYQGEEAENNVTIRCAWLRPSALEVLKTEECDKLLEKFGNKGIKVTLVDDIFAEAEISDLDNHWTLTHNPLSDFLYHDPAGLLLVSTQEMLNDLLSLILQTIEHGIPQTFADPAVLSFSAYREQEVRPGDIFPAQAKSGRALGESFYEVKTATLSQEVLPFVQQVQSLAQLVSGALPSLFGGAQEGSKTASEYSMSRTQALQRQQNTYRIFTVWWKTIFGKAIPAYIKDMKEDEKFVEKNDEGNFVNVFIRKSEVEGKIGNIEIEPSDNLPMTWMQRKEAIEKLIQLNNPQILEYLFSPENVGQIKEAIGLNELFVPGENDKIKQHEEIKLLLESQPIMSPTDPMKMQEAAAMGQMLPPEEEISSIEVDPIFDNHQIELQICRSWITSAAGRLAKTEKPDGYRNVLLHAKGHHMILAEEAMKAAESGQPQSSQPPQQEQPNV